MGFGNIDRAQDMIDRYDSGAGWGRHNRADDGVLGRTEFRDLAEDLFGDMSRSESNALFRKIDKNGDKEIDADELAAFMKKMKNQGCKKCSPEDEEDLLRKLIKMLGGDPSKCKNLSELRDMLEDLLGGGCKPKPSGGSGCGPKPSGGGCPPAPPPSGGGGNCGGGYSPPPCPPAPPPPPSAPNDDMGGGSKKDVVVTRGQLKGAMNAAEGSDDKLSRSEADKVFDYLDQKAADAGSQSWLSDSERDKIFDRFDKNGDGQLGTNEQKQFRDYMMHGIAPFDNKMKIQGWDRINNEN